MNDQPRTPAFIFRDKLARYAAVRLLVQLTLAVFLIEAMVMVLLPMLPPMSGMTATLLDASSLSLLLFPLFYYRVFRPLRRSIEERQQGELRLQALLDRTSAIGIVVIGRQGVIEEFNLASQEMFGYTKQEAIGQNVNLLMPEPHRSAHALYIQNYLTTGERKMIGYSRDTVAKRKDGSLFPISLFVDRVNLGDSFIFIGFIKDITERKQIEKKLRQSEEQYREIIDNATDFIYSSDLGGNFTSANRALLDTLGYRSEEILGEHISKIMSPMNLATAQEMTAKKMSGEVSVTRYELEIISRAGRIIPVELNSRLIYKDGVPIGVQGTGRDISERREAEQAQLLAMLVYENSSEAMMITDASSCILSVNPAFTRLTGYERDEAVGKKPKMLSSGRHDDAFYQTMWHALRTTGHWQGELWNRRKSGELYCEWLSINTIYNSYGAVHRRVAIFSDITEKKESEELIWRHANYDALTHLPNRRLFNDRLEQEISKSNRSGLPLTLMFVDLDHFKEINDQLGHALGDLLLYQAAQRIVECVRESDTVARIGGDEFTVILAETADDRHIERIAQQIILRLAEPFQLQDNHVLISASIGIANYPEDAVEIDMLLRHADKAMYAAKGEGRNRHSYFGRS